MSDAPIVIVPYRSFGTPDTLFVKGRVLHDKPVSTAEAERSAWSNLRDALRRIDSDEVSGARGRHPLRRPGVGNRCRQ